MGIGVSIIILGVLIFVHELGHFLVAKFFKVGVLEFALGFGPKLVQFNYGETTYTIRAIPLGGFVRMTGDDPRLVNGETNSTESAGGASPIEGSQELTPLQQQMVEDKSRWFLKKGYLPRCGIVIAGPLFNFLFAWVLATTMYAIAGLPTMKDGPVTIGAVATGLPAETAGLKAGDLIVSVDGREIKDFKDLVGAVQRSEGKELAFEIDRKVPDAETEAASGETSVAPSTERTTIVVKPTADAAELDVLEGRTAYRIGIQPSDDLVVFESVSLLEATKAGAMNVYNLTSMTLRVLKALLTGLISPTESIGGPLTIINETAKSAEAGWMSLFQIMIFLNVTLGVMNLLPIPVLDGGHLTLFTIEKLKGSPLNSRFTDVATQFGMVLLLLLMVFAVGNDVARLFF